MRLELRAVRHVNRARRDVVHGGRLVSRGQAARRLALAVVEDAAVGTARIGERGRGILRLAEDLLEDRLADARGDDLLSLRHLRQGRLRRLQRREFGRAALRHRHAHGADDRCFLRLGRGRRGSELGLHRFTREETLAKARRRVRREGRGIAERVARGDQRDIEQRRCGTHRLCHERLLLGKHCNRTGGRCEIVVCAPAAGQRRAGNRDGAEAPLRRLLAGCRRAWPRDARLLPARCPWVLNFNDARVTVSSVRHHCPRAVTLLRSLVRQVLHPNPRMECTHALARIRANFS